MRGAVSDRGVAGAGDLTSPYATSAPAGGSLARRGSIAARFWLEADMLPTSTHASPWRTPPGSDGRRHHRLGGDRKCEGPFRPPIRNDANRAADLFHESPHEAEAVAFADGRLDEADAVI